MKNQLRQLLKDTPTVTAIAKNIDWGGTPQGRPLPSIILRKVGGAPAVGVGGVDRQHGALCRADCWAVTYDQADQLARAVKNALSGYKSADFQCIFIEGERDVYDDREPARAYGISVDLRVWDT